MDRNKLGWITLLAGLLLLPLLPTNSIAQPTAAGAAVPATTTAVDTNTTTSGAGAANANTVTTNTQDIKATTTTSGADTAVPAATPAVDTNTTTSGANTAVPATTPAVDTNKIDSTNPTANAELAPHSADNTDAAANNNAKDSADADLAAKPTDAKTSAPIEPIDPTKPPAFLLKQGKASDATESKNAVAGGNAPLMLTTIFYSDNNKIAIINGAVVKEGEEIENYDKKVIAIETNKVVLETADGETEELTLPDQDIKTIITDEANDPVKTNETETVEQNDTGK